MSPLESMLMHVRKVTFLFIKKCDVLMYYLMLLIRIFFHFLSLFLNFMHICDIHNSVNTHSFTVLYGDNQTTNA